MKKQGKENKSINQTKETIKLNHPNYLLKSSINQTSKIKRNRTKA